MFKLTVSRLAVWCGALALCASATAGAQKPYPKLILGGPTAAVSFPLMHMVDSGALAQWTDKLEFRHWQNPDQLRVLLAKKELDFSAVPVNLPAIMANRGLDVRLLNVSVWGLLWFVSSDPEVKTVEDLAGQPLLTTFQRDLPALLLDRLLAARELTGARAPALRYTRDSQDAIALMLTGQAQNALLSEPSVSLLLTQNAAKGAAPLYRVQSMEHAWAASFPDNPVLPQAGIMANAHIAQDRALSKALSDAYAESARWCKAQVADCAAMVHKYLDFMPVAAIAESIEVTRIESQDASAARPALEALYQLILQSNPQAVGERLPAAGFYGP